MSLILLTGGIASGQATISKATIFKQIDKGNTLGFVVQIEGTNLTSPENPRVVLLPSTGITARDTPVYTATLITMSFTASSTYVPLEVTLSYTSGPVGAAITGTDCAPDVDVVKSYFLVPEEQVSKKYGHGVAKNFDVVQISIVNKCPLPVLVPLAGHLPDDQQTYISSLLSRPRDEHFLERSCIQRSPSDLFQHCSRGGDVRECHSTIFWTGIHFGCQHPGRRVHPGSGRDLEGPIGRAVAKPNFAKLPSDGADRGERWSAAEIDIHTQGKEANCGGEGRDVGVESCVEQ